MACTNTKTAEQRNAEREALLATLGERVAALSSSEEWIANLRFMAAFRRYSTGSGGLFEGRECSGSGLSVGGVVGPVSAGLAGCSYNGGGVQAENAGEHCGWDLAAELVGGGQALTSRFDTDASQ
jgi:hypothetical protein